LSTSRLVCSSLRGGLSMCIGPSDPRLPNTAGGHHHLTARRREGSNLGTIVGACAAPLTAREHFREMKSYGCDGVPPFLYSV
jgi:hypothetical protein